jgi:hypothetical protein
MAAAISWSLSRIAPAMKSRLRIILSSAVKYQQRFPPAARRCVSAE